MELPTPESSAERLLVEMLRQVVMLRAPDSVAALEGGKLGGNSSGESIARSLQTVGLLSQILPIAELHDAMEARQRAERERGFDSLTGTFAKVIADWKQLGVPADTVRELLRTFHVVPTITAHPTEAKRVTVLEKLRGIYSLLVELDGPLVTPRERALLGEELRTELDLLWMTGELKLEKPTVAQEVAWALHFFDTTLFGLVWLLHDSLALALAESYPGEQLRPAELRAVWLVGGWRSRWESERHERGDAARAARVSREVPASLPAARGRAVASAKHFGALRELFARFSEGTGARTPREQGRRAARGEKSRRALPPVAECRAAQARGHSG